jgi:hypothetical protein
VSSGCARYATSGEILVPRQPQLEKLMFGRLRWLLVAAIVLSPLTVDLRHGFTWSQASAQYLDCDPIVLKYYYSNQYMGSQIRFRVPPPNCAAPTCIRWGACKSEVTFDYGFPRQSKINPNGCLLRVCNYRPWFGR